MSVSLEHWRRRNPMDFEEAAAGFVVGGDNEDAPLRVYVPGDEDEITRACVNELRCWSCHENFPAPLGVINWPAWVAAGWGNPHEPSYRVRAELVKNNCCPICAAPSGAQIILEEIASGRRHVTDLGPESDPDPRAG